MSLARRSRITSFVEREQGMNVVSTISAAKAASKRNKIHLVKFVTAGFASRVEVYVLSKSTGTDGPLREQRATQWKGSSDVQRVRLNSI